MLSSMQGRPPAIALAVALVIILVLPRPTSGTAEKFWLRRPGTVYVCEGDTARLVWEYDPREGAFSAVYFHKILPDWGYLAGKLREEKDEPLNRARLIEDPPYGLRLEDAVLTDSGTYEVQVYVNDLSKQRKDQAALHVLRESDCPKSDAFYKPVLKFEYNIDGTTKSIPINGDMVELYHAGAYTLTVQIPAADPPVMCTIAIGNRTHTCKGRSDKFSRCMATASMGKCISSEINVTLAFIAFEPSLITLTVLCNEISTSIPHHVSPLAVVCGILLPALTILGFVLIRFFVERRKEPLDVEMQYRGGSSQVPVRPHGDEATQSLLGNEVPQLIHRACRDGDLGEVRKLYAERPGVIESTDGRGRSPLCVAASVGHKDIVQYLLEVNADPSHLSSSGLSPLHEACRQGHLDVVCLLSKQGRAVIDQLTQSGELPWQIACESHHADIFDYLVNNGAARTWEKRDNRNSPERGAASQGKSTKRVSLMNRILKNERSHLIFTNLINTCTYSQLNSSTDVVDPSKSLHWNIQYMDSALVVKYNDCSVSAGKRGKCSGPAEHNIHSNIEKLMDQFLKENPYILGKMKKTGSFYSNNAIDCVHHLQYQVKLSTAKMKSLPVEVEEGLPLYIFRIIHKGAKMPITKLLAQSFDVLIQRQLLTEGLEKSEIRYICCPNPDRSDMRVFFTWECPGDHTHDLVVDILPTLKLTDKHLAQGVEPPEHISRLPFKELRKDISKRTLRLMPYSNSKTGPKRDKTESDWTISPEATYFPVVFSYLDKHIGKALMCYRIREFLNGFLPVRISRHKDCGHWETRPVIQPEFMIITLLEEVTAYPHPEDWESHLRLTSLLTALTGEPLRQNFAVTLSHLSDTQRRSLHDVIAGDIGDLLKLLASAQDEETSQNLTNHKLIRAANYAKYDVISVLNLPPSGGVTRTIRAGWREKHRKGVLEVPGGDPDEFMCYSIPFPNNACCRYPLYRDIYRVFLDKFEKKDELVASQSN